MNDSVRTASKSNQIPAAISGLPTLKKILDNSLLGQRGLNLIEKIVLEMGFIWTAGTIEAGIDGIIETRDPAT